MKLLFQIQAPHFTAGLVYKHGHIILVAPIIHYMKYWSMLKIKQYCIKKDWRLIEIYE